MCPDLWITSLLFDLNYDLLTGASLLALAKSIYYRRPNGIMFNKISFDAEVDAHFYMIVENYPFGN